MHWTVNSHWNSICKMPESVFCSRDINSQVLCLAVNTYIPLKATLAYLSANMQHGAQHNKATVKNPASPPPNLNEPQGRKDVAYLISLGKHPVPIIIFAIFLQLSVKEQHEKLKNTRPVNRKSTLSLRILSLLISLPQERLNAVEWMCSVSREHKLLESSVFQWLFSLNIQTWGIKATWTQ